MERLLEVLRDDAARAALVERLEAETAGTPAEDEGAAGVAERIAGATAETARGIGADIRRAGRDLAALGTLWQRLGARGRPAVGEVTALGLTIVTTIAAALAFGAVAGRIGRRFAPRPGEGLARRARKVAAVSGLRLAALAAAWALGYALAGIVFTGGRGGLDPAQALYLNAFAAFGLARLLLRAVASPDADAEPALSEQAPGAQAAVYRALRAVAGVLLQGMLFVVPLAQIWGGFAVARPVRALVATLAAVLALAAIRRILRALDLSRGHRALGHSGAGEAGAAVARGAHSAWRSLWPPLATVYVVYAWFIAVTRPNLVGDIVFGGTLYTIGALAVLLVALRLLRAAPTLRTPLPAVLLGAVPRLGPRADRVLAALAWIAAAVLALAALGLVLHGWNWLDVGALLSRDTARSLLWRLVSAAIVAFAAAAIWAIVDSWIDQRLSGGQTRREVTSRTRTLLALFRNAFTIALGVIAAMIALSQIGIDIAPLLAGAGVIGLAIGFGAQKLVQDIITGIFIQLENAINEGDVVSVAGITGGVEKVTIRSVRLRTLDGAVHIVPFSSVDTVTNLTRDFSFHVAEFGVAYGERVPEVKAAMEEAFEQLKAEGHAPDILDELEMQGVIALGESSVVVRARIKTLPGRQWGLGRRYTEIVKEKFDERGIEIPFPHRQILLPPEVSRRLARDETDGGGK